MRNQRCFLTVAALALVAIGTGCGSSTPAGSSTANTADSKTNNDAGLDTVSTGQDAITGADAVTGADAADSADGSAQDAQSGDTKADTGDPIAALCDNYVSEYDTLMTQVRKCTTDSQCATQVADKLKCGCGLYVNSDSSQWAPLQQDLQDFFSHDCTTGYCGGSNCGDLGNALGYCDAGTCKNKAITCSDLDAAWAKALTDVQVCTAPADCDGKAGVGVICDACQTPVNSKLATAPSVRGVYLQLLKKLWNDLSCGPTVPCACAPFAAVDCVAGHCVTK